MARSTQNSRSGRRFIARVIARASGVGRSPPMPLLEIGCFYLISALSAKLPAVHPALPRNSVGYVFWSGCKHTLVGQSGNLDQVTLVCQLMIVESSW